MVTKEQFLTRIEETRNLPDNWLYGSRSNNSDPLPSEELLDWISIDIDNWPTLLHYPYLYAAEDGGICLEWDIVVGTSLYYISVDTTNDWIFTGIMIKHQDPMESHIEDCSYQEITQWLESTIETIEEKCTK